MKQEIEWVKVADRLPTPVTQVLVYATCCDVCYNIKIAEMEDGEWFESGTGQDLDFTPEYWAYIFNPL